MVEVVEVKTAHETGFLGPGTWVCDCARCTVLLQAASDLTVVVKAEGGRFTVAAGNAAIPGYIDTAVTEHGLGYVREAWIA